MAKAIGSRFIRASAVGGTTHAPDSGALERVDGASIHAVWIRRLGEHSARGVLMARPDSLT
jgi:hypothetical protein